MQTHSEQTGTNRQQVQIDITATSLGSPASTAWPPTSRLQCHSTVLYTSRPLRRYGSTYGVQMGALISLMQRHAHTVMHTEIWMPLQSTQ